MGMTAAKEEEAKKQYGKSRKSFTNKQCLALMKSMSNKGISTLPQKSQKGLFTGDPNKMVRPMEYVESHCLLKGHTFQLKEMLQIRIAEEANLCLIKVKTIRSDSNSLIVAGRNFYMCTTYSVQCGWLVSKGFVAEKLTFLASFHKITGSLKRRVYELHSSPSGSVICFGMQLKKLLDYHIKSCTSC